MVTVSLRRDARPPAEAVLSPRGHGRRGTLPLTAEGVPTRRPPLPSPAPARAPRTPRLVLDGSPGSWGARGPGWAV